MVNYLPLSLMILFKYQIEFISTPAESLATHTANDIFSHIIQKEGCHERISYGCNYGHGKSTDYQFWQKKVVL